MISSWNAPVVAAEHEQTSMDQDGGVLQRKVGDHAGGEAVQLLVPALRPDFGSQQPQTHLHEAVVEVTQHDVVATCGSKRLVKDDRADLPVCGWARPSAQNAQLPGERGHMERAQRVPPDAGRLAGEGEPCFDDVLDIGGRQAQFAFGILQLLSQFFQLLAELPLELEHRSHGLRFALGARRVESAAAAQHGLLDLARR